MSSPFSRLRPHRRRVTLEITSPPNGFRQDAVVALLHGLGRSHLSMRLMARHLSRRGYQVLNIGYPTGHASIPDIAREVVPLAMRAAGDAGALHFVTHSMGGILLRAWQAQASFDRPGRVVMLAPPNAGSEIIDHLRRWNIHHVAGPAGQQLGTRGAGLPAALPRDLDLELGIIAGTLKINPATLAVFRRPNDGAVAVESALSIPAKDSIILPQSHSFMMMTQPVLFETTMFLEHGRFSPRPGSRGYLSR